MMQTFLYKTFQAVSGDGMLEKIKTRLLEYAHVLFLHCHPFMSAIRKNRG